MAKSVVRRPRKSFGKIQQVVPTPNLIEVQKNSYDTFLQLEVAPGEREKIGVQAVFESVFPIKDFSDQALLEFVKYDFDEPKYDVDECQQRGMTFAAPLRVTLRLLVWDVDEETGARSIRDIKEQDVYMGDIPLMTKNGTFIINGTERVIVSQMQRSPGVFFDHDKGKSHPSGKLIHAARVIPYRGSWLDFEFDAKDLVYVRIDRRRKLHATSFLMGLCEVMTPEAGYEMTEEQGLEAGMTSSDILNEFYNTLVYKKAKKGWKVAFDAKRFKGQKLGFDLVDAKSNKVVLEKEKKLTPRTLKKLDEGGLEEILVPTETLVSQYFAEDIINEETGEIFVEAGDEITEETLGMIDEMKLGELSILDIDHVNVGPYIRDTLAADKNANRIEALIDIYRVMRPGEPPTYEAAENLFRSLFFDPDRFDLSAVGRVKMDAKLGLDAGDEVRTLRKEDVISILKYLVDLKDGRGEVDDIDHLGNRRVRSAGELVENQFRIGLVRMERSVKERMSSIEIDAAMPYDLINSKPIVAAMREFFGSSQLSQFMDQTNPLSEITHKRRLSALGPGGLTRERAGFEVRDVHPTHYGRICPIETPEGPNIGLINSLATYARVNQYGFIESPYRKVVDGVVLDEVVYLSAMEEMKYTVAQANAELDDKKKFVSELISCRQNGDYLMMRPSDIDLMDVSPKQLVSVAASLIPFLENDDANRALMGSNMQRQAVPLIKTESPLVGTGMEATVSQDSGASIVALRDGIVDQIDGTRIVVRGLDGSEYVDIYNLQKFQRSNQNTCINQRPVVKVGNLVKKGEIIADGPASQDGELALGRNVLCAFMPWNGYNFEDSILISERLVRDDVYTSIHIEEFEVMARDTKLGQEDITRDIPNVSEESLRNLDEAGIVFVGAEVKPGDILVGKVTPKGESPMTPEEKLLRAIFGEKASDVRDTSLKLPPGVSGTVVEVRVFSRRGVDKDERALAIERLEIERLAKDRDAEKAIIERTYYDNLKKMLINQTVAKGPKGFKAGVKITEDVLSDLSYGQWRQVVVKDEELVAQLEELGDQFDRSVDRIEATFQNKVEKLQRGDELPPGVLKMVKVFVAVKRKLQPGDKMAGRHGNKGVISKIMPVEDMPYLEDGTSVDLVLNPLGVPSRMNVGQILETHLGWASAGLGNQIRKMLEDAKAKTNNFRENETAEQELKPLKTKLKDIYGDKVYKDKVDKLDIDDVVELSTKLSGGVPMATPVFDGAHEADIVDMLKLCDLDSSGQVTLFDGRTGEAFDRPVTVGYIYMLKLHHLVDDKIHARSVGPYSLVTQQPLGGKAQFGGQRFGEMEVWALEAYGAAYTLQEMLTVKSDDVAGRTKVYEAIVRGDDNFESGIPESFNVLVKELRSLCLNVDLGQLGN